MITSSKSFWTQTVAISSIFILQVGATMCHSETSGEAVNADPARRISVVICTDHSKYSLNDVIKLEVSLENIGERSTYVDRRMFWGGFAGGLKVEVTDEQGEPVPSLFLEDALMPPPVRGDPSILIRLDRGFFYGTWMKFPVKDRFTKPGRYAIRVIYKSWLRKEFVAPQLRDLPVMWADTPEIPSAPVWVEITQ